MKRHPEFLFWFLAIILLCGNGCTWDPPHDNPVDPKYKLAPLQKLAIRVLNLNLADQLPISDATVLLPALRRFETTGADGWAYFNDMSIGTFWVVAYKENGENPAYATDSILVTTNYGSTTTARIHLDALPVFEEVTANAMTIKFSLVEDPVKKVRLRARVYDPDGPADLHRIEWHFNDMTGIMSWDPDPDSAFYWVDVPSDSFPGGQIDTALTAPFQFRAYDGAGNSASASTSLSRIINGVPVLYDPYPPERPEVRWTYLWFNDFSDTQQFRYLLRIYRDDIDDNTVVYDTLLTHDTADVSHLVAEYVPAGEYFHYVWVMDHLGNTSRSKKVALRKSKSPE